MFEVIPGKPEVHHGVVVEVGDGLTKLKMTAPDGREYVKELDTAFLVAGLGELRPGDAIVVTFLQETEPVSDKWEAITTEMVIERAREENGEDTFCCLSFVRR